jgi:replication factor C subunit 1
MAGIGSDEELSRDLASDIVKMLGGRVTTGVSGKTDYLVLGSILEDGRPVEDGSKHKKVLEIYDTWSAKHRGDCNGGGKAKGKTAKKTKAQDPNSLVEIIRGVDEFYGLIKFMSEWKKGTLPEEERAKLEASQTTAKKEAAPPPAPAAATSAPVTVPYSKATVTNPYAKTVPVNPYSKSKSTPVNPYNKSALPTNPYAKKAADTSPSTDTQPIETKPAVFQINALWADKYAPSNSREILGNSDSVNKLSNWLHNWEATFNDPKKKQKGLSGPNGPWKAALLSGPPGIGKTTTATLVAKELNRDVIELNASDARSKKALTEALGDLSGTHALNFANAGSSKSAKTAPRKRCIIMDEVDGMGAGDRSGISELIQMIKKSKVPIICICNDRSSQKMKSLVQYCMDLRYRRPTKNVIARRAVEVGRLEGMVVEHNAAEALSESCGNDIRQVLNCLQMWSSKKPDNNASTSLTFKELRERQNDINKDEVLRVSMFDATKLIVEGSRGLEHADNKTATTSLLKRSDAYFVDYMLMGLNVHQNYLKVALGQFNQAKLKGDEEIEQKALEELHNATLAMSDFGVCEEQLRGADQNWSLLPLCSMLAVKVSHFSS